jgi:hypothetical protein
MFWPFGRIKLDDIEDAQRDALPGQSGEDALDKFRITRRIEVLENMRETRRKFIPRFPISIILIGAVFTFAGAFFQVKGESEEMLSFFAILYIFLSALAVAAAFRLKSGTRAWALAAVAAALNLLIALSIFFEIPPGAFAEPVAGPLLSKIAACVLLAAHPVAYAGARGRLFFASSVQAQAASVAGGLIALASVGVVAFDGFGRGLEAFMGLPAMLAPFAILVLVLAALMDLLVLAAAVIPNKFIAQEPAFWATFAGGTAFWIFACFSFISYAFLTAGVLALSAGAFSLLVKEASFGAWSRRADLEISRMRQLYSDMPKE